MGFRKLFAVMVSACVLGAQLWIILPPFDVSKGWYWPFLNYPMYSRAKLPGDAFVLYELRGEPCERGRTASPLSAYQLGVRRFRMYAMLEAVGEADASPAKAAAADSAMALLDTLVAGQSGPPICTLDLWRRVVNVGPATGAQPRPEWTVVRTWSTGRPRMTARSAGVQDAQP